jgi:ketosteroid isomerase-like protein
MNAEQNVSVIREVFRAIEERDLNRLQELFHPEVEFHWAPSLPYGGNLGNVPGQGPTWAETWIPLQPDEDERRMDLRVVAAEGDEVVGFWQQRGKSGSGERIDTPVLALYRLKDGKLRRAQMFYFDSAQVGDFLRRSAEQ